MERVVEKTMPLVSSDLEIRVFGRSGGSLPAVGMLGSVPCFRLQGGSMYLSNLMRHFKKWMPDKVDVHNRPALAYRLKRHLPGTKVYLTLHSTTFISESCLPGTKAQRMLEYMDGIIVNSSHLHREVERRFPGLGEKMMVNPLGVSLEDFNPRWSPAAEALRRGRLEDYGWKTRKIILYIGRLIPGKGIHRILEALPGIIEQEKEALLVIVGSAFYGVNTETQYVKYLRKLAEPYSNHTAFLPYIPYPQVADLYNLADLVVVPSMEEEAFGLVNLEAMASAVPVAASEVGGIPEIVQHGTSGILLPKGSSGQDWEQSIVRLLADRKLRKKLGMAGRERARTQFRWEHTAARWAEIMKADVPELARSFSG